GSCPSGTRFGRDASSAGSNSAAHTPNTAATATSCGTLATPDSSAATRVPAATAWAASQPSMTFLRFQRSTSAPAGSPASSWAAAVAASTSPEAAAEPVTASTSSGKAIVEALKPNPDSTWLLHSSRESRLRDSGTVIASPAVQQGGRQGGGHSGR